jgi:hypothetical protein
MCGGCNSGGPGGARTPNPQFRRLMLYPIELQGRNLVAGGRKKRRERGKKRKTLGWETGIEPATVGATVRCSTS